MLFFFNSYYLEYFFYLQFCIFHKTFYITKFKIYFPILSILLKFKVIILIINKLNLFFYNQIKII